MARVRAMAVSYEGDNVGEALAAFTGAVEVKCAHCERVTVARIGENFRCGCGRTIDAANLVPLQTRAELEGRIAELEQALRAVIPWASKGGWNGRVPPEVKRAKKVLGAAVRPPKGGG
jgi:hypothetical protein